MKKKYTQDELLKLDAVEIYKLVLTNEIKIFPMGFWQRPKAMDNAIKCTKFLIEEVLNLNEEELKEQLGKKFFNNNKLAGMLIQVFNRSPYNTIINIYPERNYKVWEFKNCTPKGYWENKENGIKATKWLIEEKLKLNDEQLKEQLSQKLFHNNGLSGMLSRCFKDSPYDAINSTYPERNYKPWQFNQVPNKYWNKDTSVLATRWLIEEYLKLDDKELKEKLNSKLFQENGLSGMLETCFNASPYEAINSAYPNKFKISDFKSYSKQLYKEDKYKD